MTTITAKIQIYVPYEHTEILIKTTKAYREACNYLSAIVFKTKELNQRKLNDMYYQEMRGGLV